MNVHAETRVLESRDPRRVYNRAAHAQRGVTLTETLLVLGVAAILAAAAYRAYSMASNDARTSELSNSTVALVTKVKNVWGTDGDYSALNTSPAEKLENSGVLPPQFRKNGTKINDIFGNEVTVTGGSASFTVGFTNLSRDTCSTLASSLSGVAYAINVGNATATNGALGAGGKPYKGPTVTTSSGLDSAALADVQGCGVANMADRKLVAEIR